jgi:pimeloyl-ACP methyl ester carboxylesterase
VFAVHHRARAAVAQGRGVVLCNPFGIEAMSAHRAYRHLAERLADAGISAVRFDYHGTGDSSGSDDDPDRLGAWVESVRACVKWLRARDGVSEVSLFGVRFGALVAMQAANASEPRIEGLVLMAPAATGRSWLREQRAFQSMRGRPSEVADGEEVVGFHITSETATAISGLDPAKSDGATVKRALVVARDDLPGGEGALVAKLEARGAEVTLSRSHGYRAMMTDDAYKSIVPEHVWTEIVAWLSEPGPARLDHVNGEAPIPVEYAIIHENKGALPLREEAVEMNGLFGVLSEPLDTALSAGRPAILMNTIGANHRVGSNRLYVKMARRWARLGFPVLRFDVSGMGDSPPREGAPENYVYSNHAKEDARAAMDFLGRARGIDRFALVGLCSGAFVSFHAAVADPRAVAIVLINILAFHWHAGDSLEVRTRNTYKSTKFYSDKAFDPEVWQRLLRGEVNALGIAGALAKRVVARARRRATELVVRESDVARGFRAILKRKAHVLLVFAADDGGLDLVDEHLGAGGERLRHERRFRMEIIEGPDHTFTPIKHQHRLTDLLTEFLESHFGAAAPPPSSRLSIRNLASAPLSRRDL